jgi:hypothetical protein
MMFVKGEQMALYDFVIEDARRGVKEEVET